MMWLVFYLFKVFVCSGVLFMYYLFFLRNRLFHQWNRYYLLSAVFFSLLLPLIQFEILMDQGQHRGPVQLILIGQSADNYLQEIVITNANNMGSETLLLLAYSLVSLFLLLSLFYSLHRIFLLIRTHTISILHNIKFINTEVKDAPFSFLNYIFWNRDIPLQTKTGQQIFQHELVHVQEKHTIDKLLLEVVIALFWYNPFFWLLRKELRYIHEFIADQKSVGESGTEAFAAMVLQSAYPQHFQSITNPFFQTSIKRRLLMLTKRKNSKAAYVGRVVALPLVAVLVLSFTIRTKEKAHTLLANTLGSATAPDTLPKNHETIKAIDVNKKKGEITIRYKDGTSETVTEKQAYEKGLLTKRKSDKDVPNNILELKTNSEKPLFILDGKEITKAEMDQLDPNTIQSIDVLKDKSATDKYGEKGKNGVIVITTKQTISEGDLVIKANGDNVQLKSGTTSFEAKEITVVGYKKEKITGSEGGSASQSQEKPASVNIQAWRSFLESNLRTVIVKAAETGAKPGSYTVHVRFLVKTDGSVSEFMALNKPGYDLEKSVVAIMANSPKWQPAELNGTPVNSYHTQPITFVIAQQ